MQAYFKKNPLHEESRGGASSLAGWGRPLWAPPPPPTLRGCTIVTMNEGKEGNIAQDGLGLFCVRK